MVKTSGNLAKRGLFGKRTELKNGSILRTGGIMAGAGLASGAISHPIKTTQNIGHSFKNLSSEMANSFKKSGVKAHGIKDKQLKFRIE